jgi:hypothetical protein
MTHSRLHTPTAENGPRQGPISEETIRNRAHEIYERRGAEPGREVDDWLEAERELKEHDQ